MAPSKQPSKHTHARAQCSHDNVGLAQARPNYSENEYALICLGSYCTNEFHTHFRNLTSYHGKFAAEIDHYLAITFPTVSMILLVALMMARTFIYCVSYH